MAAKKSKGKAAASKPAAKKPAVSKAPPSKVTAPKPATGKPVALQTVAKKTTPSKAAAKSSIKSGKNVAKRAALNGSAQSVIESPKPADTETFYFVVGHMDAQISNQRLANHDEVASSESFDEVKDKAVDHLIELVDLLERRLWEIKRSQDFASYLALRELS